MPMNVVTQQTLKEEKNNHIQDEQDSLMPDETSHIIVQYNHDSLDGEDFICGICKERFDDKTTLKEHIKIHI